MEKKYLVAAMAVLLLAALVVVRSFRAPSLPASTAPRLRDNVLPREESPHRWEQDPPRALACDSALARSVSSSSR